MGEPLSVRVEVPSLVAKPLSLVVDIPSEVVEPLSIWSSRSLVEFRSSFFDEDIGWLGSLVPPSRNL